MKTDLVLTVLINCLTIAIAQRVAPGVPPQNYQHQQQQHIPQHHQVPVQHQQVPIQPQHVPQQHIPQQQQHIPQQQQHIPQQQHQQMHQQQQQVPNPHHHASGHHNPQLLNPGNIAHEKEHIAEHLEVPIDTSKMSEQELQFHYFKMHDADNNNRLDGCELIKSLIHYHEEGSRMKHGEGSSDSGVQEKIFSDEELVGLIDPILTVDDGNRDGFIDYPEFVKAQQKAQQQQQQQKNH